MAVISSTGARSAGASPVIGTILLCLTGIGVVSQLYVPIPLVDYISERYQVSAVSASMAGSVFGLFYACAFLFFGPLSDRIGRKKVLVSGFCLLAATSLLVAFAPGFETMLAARAVQGFCAASFSPVALAYVADHFEGKARSTALAFLTTSLFLSGIIGQVYASLMALHFGWEALFVGTTLFYLIAATLLSLFLIAQRGSGERGSMLATYAVIPRLLRHRRLLAVYIATALVLGGFAAFYAGLGPELVRRYGLAPHEIVVIRAAALPVMLVALVVGRLLPRIGSRRFIIAGLTVAGASFALTGIPAGFSVMMALNLGFVLGIAFLVPTMMFRINEFMTEGRGAAAALYTLTLFAGASIGVWAGSLAASIGFSLFTCAAGVVYLATLLCFLWLDAEPAGKRG